MLHPVLKARADAKARHGGAAIQAAFAEYVLCRCSEAIEMLEALRGEFCNSFVSAELGEVAGNVTFVYDARLDRTGRLVLSAPSVEVARSAVSGGEDPCG